MTVLGCLLLLSPTIYYTIVLYFSFLYFLLACLPPNIVQHSSFLNFLCYILAFCTFATQLFLPVSHHCLQLFFYTRTIGLYLRFFLYFLNTTVLACLPPLHQIILNIPLSYILASYTFSTQLFCLSPSPVTKILNTIVLYFSFI